jgi:3-isopropylmalate/(R)-2-methylmalate dehydratase large subunit
VTDDRGAGSSALAAQLARLPGFRPDHARYQIVVVDLDAVDLVDLVADGDGAGLVLAADGAPRDRLAARLSAYESSLRRLPAALGLDYGRCGVPLAEMVVTGRIAAGAIVVARGGAVAGVGALGALGIEVDADGLARVLRGEALEAPRLPPLRVVLRGERDRFVAAIDVAFALATALRAARGRPLELGGEGYRALPIADRFALCAALGPLHRGLLLGEVDEELRTWLLARREHVAERRDPVADGGEAIETIEFDVASVEPATTPAFAPAAPTAICDLPPTAIEAVEFGGAEGGRIEDLRIAASFFREHHLATGVRCVVRPATVREFLHAIQEGLIGTLLRAGCRIEGPGGSGVLSASPALTVAGVTLVTGTPAVPSTPPPRLVSSAVAAASAILGRFAHPDEVVRRRKESV